MNLLTRTNFVSLLLAPPFQMGYMQQGMPPQGQQQQQQQHHHQQVAPAPPVMEQPILEEEPPSKKLRSEDHLLAESQFLELHKVYFLNILSTIQLS